MDKAGPRVATGATVHNACGTRKARRDRKRAIEPVAQPARTAPRNRSIRSIARAMLCSELA